MVRNLHLRSQQLRKESSPKKQTSQKSKYFESDSESDEESEKKSDKEESEEEELEYVPKKEKRAAPSARNSFPAKK